ncbi:TPA: NADH-quinone oxidoreductase subunit A [Candidatus Sumerlaeota bacterium]|nr:NADH-quinone oxidoreductase subunit A [Candidatus Sumerlaeota bacterium]
MQPESMETGMAFFFVLMFFGLAVMMVASGLVFSRLLAPHRPGRLKDVPYECGELPVGRAWIQYNVGYYLFGLLFLIFDVEAAFLYPWAVAFRELGMVGFVEMAIFLFVLLLGLAYAWKKGVLEWV